MQTEFEMTQEDLERIYEANRPIPVMTFGDLMPLCPQDCVNAVWTELGKKMGFKPETVKPVPGKGDRFFTAEKSGGKERE